MMKSVPTVRVYFSSLALGMLDARVQLRMFVTGMCVFVLGPWIEAVDLPCHNHDLCFSETWWPLVSFGLTSAGLICFLASLVGLLVAGLGKSVFLIIGHQEQIATLIKIGRLFNWFMMFGVVLGLTIWIVSLL